MALRGRGLWVVLRGHYLGSIQACYQAIQAYCSGSIQAGGSIKTLFVAWELSDREWFVSSSCN